MRELLIIVFSLVAVFFTACGGDGTSEPIQYPGDVSVETSSSISEALAEESSSSSQKYVSYGLLVDKRDDQKYKTVVINGLEWMAENLNYAYLQSTATLDSTSWCYDNNPENCKKYGRLYLWSAAMDSVALFGHDGEGCGRKDSTYKTRCKKGDSLGVVRGVCPEGWHLPSMRNDLYRLDSTYYVQKTGASAYKSDSGWEDGGNGTNDIGLNVLPSGGYSLSLDLKEGTFYDIGKIAYFWTSDEGLDLPYPLIFQWNSDNYGTRGLGIGHYDGFAVRCVKNEPTSSSSIQSSSSNNTSIIVKPCKTETEDNCEYGILVDERDGQTYKTVKIGEQWWMAENLNYAYLQPTSTLDSSSWCYDNDPENCKKLGRLYLWSAAIDSAALFSINGKGFGYGDDCGTLARPKKCSPDIPLRGVCPSGWHLTSTEEWLDLLFAVDGDLANLLKSRNEWPNGLGGEDAFGFGVLPSGMASSRGNTVSYWQLGEYTDFWTSGGESTTAWTSGVLSEDDFSWKWDALPVRCIKDVPDME